MSKAGALHLCKCMQPALKLVSKTDTVNKGREFYRCAGRMAKDCNYFAWADGKRPFRASPIDKDKEKDRLQRAAYVIYTDGACQGNAAVADKRWPCGWAAVVLKRSSSTGELDLHDEVYGPAVLDASHEDYLGAQVTSNNTAELSAIGEAFRWLLNDASASSGARVPVVIRFDSEYAANSVQGLYKSKKNVLLISTIQQIYRDVVSRGFDVSFMHVKGHSSERWNDRADELANLGATGKRNKRLVAVSASAAASVDMATTPSKRIRS
jgi:ribonuclease HI